VRRFGETESGTIDAVSAARVYLAVGGPNVMWRVTIQIHAATGTLRTMQMDVGYLTAGDVLVKVRVATCGCDPGVTLGELLPGELAALQAIALRLERS